MKYFYDDENIKLAIEPVDWNKNSPKEILQYAVGGLLYMPGTNTKIVQDIKDKKYPHMASFVLCLEDALGDEMVKKGEYCVKQILTDLYAMVKNGELSINDLPLIFIRVREAGQMTRLHKICGNRAFSMLTGFILPKFDKTNCVQYVEEFKTVLANSKKPLYIMPIIESKNAMYRQLRMENLLFVNDALKLIADNVLNIRVGAADFCNIFGLRRGMDTPIYSVNVIADCLADIINVFARNYICSAPVWEYFGTEPGEWSEGLKQELVLDRVNGFTGKTCIHPTQLPYIQQNYIVSYENYKDAINILGMSTGLTAVTKGFGNNKMNEVKTHSFWARKILGLASIYGVKAEEIVESSDKVSEEEIDD